MEGSGHLTPIHPLSRWLVGTHSRSERFWRSEQTCTYLIQTPDHPAQSQSLYLLHHPGPFYILWIENLSKNVTICVHFLTHFPHWVYVVCRTGYNFWKRISFLFVPKWHILMTANDLYSVSSITAKFLIILDSKFHSVGVHSKLTAGWNRWIVLNSLPDV
jgi:hypothetical protein